MAFAEVPPQFNYPRLFGVRAGSPVIFRLPVSGTRPMRFSAEGLPSGVVLDSATGILSGSCRDKATNQVVFSVENAAGRITQKFRLVVGDEFQLTPPMGFNTFGGLGCGERLNEKSVRASIDALLSKGLADHGYAYCNIDDGWQGARGGPFFALQPNSKFGDMRRLADHVHSLGLKFGIYSTPYQFNSGKLHNAIPRDGMFVIAVPNALKENIKADWNIFASDVADEFNFTDTQMVWTMDSTDAEPVIEAQVARQFIYALQAVHNGIYAICQDPALNGMVETSSNIASIVTKETEITILSSQRSNVMSNLDNMCDTIGACFLLAGADVKHSDGYPAWKMRSNSELQRIVIDSYKKLFGKDPIVRGIHAGLECGLFSERYPNLDMVSFGPTLRFVHTPDERLHIPTVQMVWDHLIDVLKHIPEK